MPHPRTCPSRPLHASEGRRLTGALVVGLYAMVVLALFAFFHPIWTADLIPTKDWDARIWFSNWI